MSSDNGIYIAQFKDGFRVVHGMAVDNLKYYPRGSQDEMDTWKDFFCGSITYATLQEAYEQANILYLDWPICEYGIVNLGTGVDWSEPEVKKEPVSNICSCDECSEEGLSSNWEHDEDLIPTVKDTPEYKQLQEVLNKALSENKELEILASRYQAEKLEGLRKFNALNNEISHLTNLLKGLEATLNGVQIDNKKLREQNNLQPKFNFRVVLGIAEKGETRQDKIVGDFAEFRDAYTCYDDYKATMNRESGYDTILLEHYVGGQYKDFCCFLVYTLKHGEFTEGE